MIQTHTQAQRENLRWQKRARGGAWGGRADSPLAPGYETGDNVQKIKAQKVNIITLLVPRVLRGGEKLSHNNAWLLIWFFKFTWARLSRLHVASCQQAWTMLCCQLMNNVVNRHEQCCAANYEQCCQQAWTMFCCQLWTMLSTDMNNVVLPTIWTMLSTCMNNVLLPTMNNVVNKVVQPWKQCCYSIIQPPILLQYVNKVEQQW